MRPFTLCCSRRHGKTGSKIIPETELEQERFDAALRRKQLSLVLAGKMKPRSYRIESIVHVKKRKCKTSFFLQNLGFKPKNENLHIVKIIFTKHTITFKLNYQ
jgi:hypothetical protein